MVGHGFVPRMEKHGRPGRKGRPYKEKYAPRASALDFFHAC